MPPSRLCRQSPTCALLAFSQLLHRRAEGLGQRRVTKEEAEVEVPPGPGLPHCQICEVCWVNY